MRFLTPAALALALALALHAPARGQPPPKVSIDDKGVRIGFDGLSGDLPGSKTGFWAPVYVQITSGIDRIGPADGTIVVSTTDSDDLENTFKVPLPPMEAKTQTTVLAYVRTGAPGSDVNVTIRDDRNRVLPRSGGGRTGYAAAPPGAFLWVTAGGGAAAGSVALHNALVRKKPGAENNPQQAFPGGGMPALEDDDPSHLTSFAYVGQERDLPARWFGYHGADVLVLETGSKTFTEDLLNDKYNRKEALTEWVHRGGRLVVSVGHEHQLVRALLEQTQLIPCTVNGTVQLPGLSGIGRWAGAPQDRLVARAPKDKPGERPPVDLARIEVQPGRGVQVLADEVDGDKRWPVVVQASAGLGRVILVGLDLEREPFTDWAGQAKFWQKLNAELRGASQAERNAAVNNPNFGAMNGMGMPAWDPTGTDVTSVMVQRLESFTEVPVISFGWVALFILVYILVVGPLDYFFLKKVVKRLELTWITFPAVVIAVSALAYVSAYYLKGNDLRINKVDLVDVVAEPADPDAGGAPGARGARAYGSTWFTVFSPRIQNYTIGVEPAAGAWVPELGKGAPPNPHSALVTWMGKPENAWGGGGRPGGSTSLFRRPYEYAPDAAGLTGVPIQVWSTKSFTGSWQAALAEDRPLVRADLRHTREVGHGDLLTGSITFELPAELSDAVLFYQNTRYDLGTLAPGTTKKLEPALVVGGGGALNRRIDDWFSDIHVAPNTNNWGRRGPVNQMQTAQGIIKDVMFGDKDTGGSHARNSTLRYLDESWRLTRPGEAIVVGRLARLEEGAEQVSQDPASPSRLWLGQLPKPGETRPFLPGKMTQEAYVRIFIPVTTK